MQCIGGTDGYFKKVNSAFTTTLGWNKEEMLRHPFTFFLHPDDIASSLIELENLKAGIPTVFFENRYRCKDGSYKERKFVADRRDG